MCRSNLKGTHQRFVDAHHGARVVELPAVVRRREECDQLTFRKELITVLDHLVGCVTTISDKHVGGGHLPDVRDI